MPRHEVVSGKSRKRSSKKRRTAYVHGSREANPVYGVLPLGMRAKVPPSEGPSATHTLDHVVECSCWRVGAGAEPVSRLNDIDYG